MTWNTKTLQRSFAGGEMTPQMFSRPDDSKLVNGAAKVRNMISLPQGAAIRRPGTRFVAKTKDQAFEAYLHPFIFNETQSFAIQSSRATVDSRTIGYFRFHTNGGTLLYSQPKLFITRRSVTFNNTTEAFTSGVAHGLTTGDPVALTVRPVPTSGPTATVAASTSSSPQVMVYTGANLDVDQQFILAADGGTLPADMQAAKLYWVLTKNGNNYTFSESYRGPPRTGGATTGTIRIGALPQANGGFEGAFRANVLRYAIVTGATTFELAETLADALAGTNILGGNNGLTDFAAHFGYVNGDLVDATGFVPGDGNFYCFRAPWCSAPEPIGFTFCHENDHLGHPPSATTHWARLPGTFNAAVTVDTGTDTIDCGAAHGGSNGDPVIFSGTTPPSPLAFGTVFYLRNVTANTFQVSLTPAGDVLDLLTTGTAVDALVNPIYEVPHYYSDAELQRLNLAQSNDVLTIASGLRPAAELSRLSATRWELNPVRFVASVAVPDPPFAAEANPGEGNTIIGVRSTTVLQIGNSGSRHLLSQGDIVRVTGLGANGPIGGAAGETIFVTEFIFNANEIRVRRIENGDIVSFVNGTGLSGRIRFIGASDEELENTYVVTAIDENGEESAASGELTIDNLLLTPGAFNRVGWNPVEGATRYRLYKKTNGLFGFIGETEGLEFKDQDIGPDLTITPPIPDASLRRTSYVTFDLTNDLVNWPNHGMRDGATVQFFTNGALPANVVQGTVYYVANSNDDSFQLIENPALGDIVNITTGLGAPDGEQWGVGGNFPSAVTYFEGRRFFAGSIEQPHGVWATASGTESDMSYSLPTVASDRVFFRISSREGSAIRQLVPLSQLLLLSSSLEYRLTPINDDAVTPTSISIRPQSYIGCSLVQPSVVNNNVVFAAARGGHVRELGYRQDALGYVTGDLSFRTAHLFDGLTIVQQALQKAPAPIVWFVSSNGKLLGLTYVPGESVGAWHQHDTDGTYKAVTVIPEGEQDAVYTLVNRDNVRMVEWSDEHFQTGDSINDAFFVDSGVSYSGPATTALGGLDHLNGKTVAYLADGVPGTAVVSNGQITLATAATNIVAGLPYTSQINTVPLYMQLQGFGSGRTKNINKAWVRVSESGDFRVGPLGEVTVPSQEPAEGLLHTKLVEVVVPGSWNDEGQIEIRQSDPLPLTVVGLTLEVAIGN